MHMAAAVKKRRTCYGLHVSAELDDDDDDDDDFRCMNRNSHMLYIFALTLSLLFRRWSSSSSPSTASSFRTAVQLLFVNIILARSKRLYIIMLCANLTRPSPQL